MDGFYPQNQLPSQELQQQISQQSEDQPPTQPPLHDLSIQRPDPGTSSHIQLPPQQCQFAMYNQMASDQADIEEMQRRRSVPQVYGHQMTSMPPNPAPRRMSSIGANDMMAFGSSDNDFGSFQFNQNMAPSFQAIDANLGGMQDQMGNYMTDSANFSAISPDIMGTMMSSQFANMDMGQMATESGTMDLFPITDVSRPNPPITTTADHFDPNQLATVADDYNMIGPETTSMATTSNTAAEDFKSADEPGQGMMSDVASQSFAPVEPSGAQLDERSKLGADNGGFAPGPKISPPPPGQMSSSSPAVRRQDQTSTQTQTQDQGQNQNVPPAANVTSSGSVDASATGVDPTSREPPKEKAIYSKSGFDMLKALWLVATRKNPRINLGAVDMSCAFVVCDITMNDCPIIYVSDNFQNLTGYVRHEIVGQNCRFLQAPDGKVEAGSRREFVDDGAVYNLKTMIHSGQEVQQSLINYRKGGKPFLNLLTMIPIPWDTDEIRYFIGFQIDLVECPDAISGQEMGSVKVNYKHSDIGQYIWTPPPSTQWEPDNGQTLGMDDVSTLLQQFNPSGQGSDWHRQSWDKMLLENNDDVVHVLSLKGLFLYLSPACKRVLEYDATDLVGNSLSSVCHPSDIVPVTRELKDATTDNHVNIVFRIRRKQSGYTWFESHGSLFIEQGKGRKCIILVGRKRPVFALSRRSLEANGGIGDSELWTKLSTSGMFLSVSSNVRSLLDLQPESLIGTSIQDLMRKDSRGEFGRTIEKTRRGKIATCKHEVQNRRGQGLQAQTTLYPGDTTEGQKPSFLLAQTKLLKASSRNIAPAAMHGNSGKTAMTAIGVDMYGKNSALTAGQKPQNAIKSLPPGTHDAALASEDNIFDELRTTKCSSWQFELRQMEKINRILAEELGSLLSNKKKRKRRKGVGNMARNCANCHTRNTPEWRRGPSGQRDLCNSCGLRWAKQTGRVSPRNSTRGGHNGNGDSQSKKSTSPIHSSPLHRTDTLNAGGTGGDGVSGMDHGEDGGIDPAQLATKAATTSSGVISPTGAHAFPTMPPSGQMSLTAGALNSVMASIREEREVGQAQLDESPPFV